MWPMSLNKALGALAGLLLTAGAAFGQQFIGSGFWMAPAASPSTPMIQPLMASMIIPAATGNRWTQPIGSSASGATATTAIRGIPVPVTTTISGLYANVPAAATAGVIKTWTINSSNTSAAGNESCPLSSATSCDDTSNTDSLTAGDSLSLQFSASAAWTSGGAQYSLLSTPGDHTSGMFLSMVSLGTLTATSYTGMNIGVSQTATANSTEVDASTVLPVGITVTGLFFDPNTTISGSVLTTATICKNGSGGCSGPSCAPPGGGVATGCCVTTLATTNHVPRSSASCGSTTNLHFAAGDTISIAFTCSSPGSCISMNAGVSVSYTPDTAGQSIVTSQPYGNLSVTSWAAMNDYQLQTTQVNWNMLPYMNSKTATFANMIACTDTNPGGAGNYRTFTSQLGASPGTLPTTPGSPIAVQLGNGGGACTGGSSGFLLGGGQDLTHHVSATAGETVDYTQTITGSPVTSNHTYKLSQTVVVQ